MAGRRRRGERRASCQPIAARPDEARRGLHLRYVEGGCDAVAVELNGGRWRRIDASRTVGACSRSRRVPLGLLRTALRGYVRDVEEQLRASAGDPNACVVAPFPIETPLRRIDVTSAADAGMGPAPVLPAHARRPASPLGAAVGRARPQVTPVG